MVAEFSRQCERSAGKIDSAVDLVTVALHDRHVRYHRVPFCPQVDVISGQRIWQTCLDPVDGAIECVVERIVFRSRRMPTAARSTLLRTVIIFGWRQPGDRA
jgi:hypothetical protein